MTTQITQQIKSENVREFIPATAHTPLRNYSSHNSFLSYHVRDKSQSKLIFFSSPFSSAPETFKYYATNIWYRIVRSSRVSLPRTSRVNSIFADQKLILELKFSICHRPTKSISRLSSSSVSKRCSIETSGESPFCAFEKKKKFLIFFGHFFQLLTDGLW